MSKKTYWSVSIVASLALAAFIAVPQANAVTGPVSSVTVADDYSTTLGATTSYTLTVTFSETIPVDSNITFNNWSSSPCPPEQSCGLDFSAATISGLTGNVQNPSAGEQPNWVNVNLTSAVAAGAVEVTIGNAVNASQSGMYSIGVEVNLPGAGGGPGASVSAPVFIGAIAVKGQVKMPDGTPVSQDSGVGVNARDDNFTTNINSGISEGGYYAIPVESVDEWNPGTITTGNTYWLEVWPGNAEGVVSPDPVSFVYNGTMITKNLTLVAAVKTINVSVKYPDGTPVTTANIWANKMNGGGGAGGDVDSNGELALSVSGGRWDVMVNCGWNPETNMPQDCDWTLNEPPKQVSFNNDSTTETKTVVFTVQKTNAKIQGTVKLPDGTPLPGGFIDIRAGEMGGSGTGINPQDGSFSANLVAGDYKLMVFPDEWQNPDLAKYYSDEIDVRLAVDETKTLNIVMKEKTSKITGTVVDSDGNGVSGVRLNTWNIRGAGWSNTTSGEAGVFSFWVSPGEWEINIDMWREEGSSATSYIPADSRPVSVTVADNETVSGVTLTVQVADATIVVKAVNANGSAITEFWGWAFCRIKGAGWGPGSEFGNGLNQGTATIPLLGGKTYVCGMHMPPEGNQSLKEEVEVSVGVGESKDVKLTLVENDSAIIGWVKDQNGLVVTGVEAEVFAVEVGNWQWRPGKLNPDGSFNISVLGGTDKRFMVGVHFWGDSSGYMETFPEPDSAVAVPANSQVTQIITVFKADTSISGTVYAPDGTPMPHVWVDAGNWKQLEGKMKGDFEGGKVIHAGTETRADGTYTIDIVSGDYTVNSGMPPEFEGDYMSPREIDVTVTAAAPATGVDLWYRQADAFVNATLAFEDGTSPMFGWCYAWSEEGGHSGKEAMSGSSRIPLTAGTWWVGCDTFTPDDNKFYRAPEQQITLVVGDNKSASFTLQEESFTIPESFSTTFTATQQNNFTMPDGTTVQIPANAAGTDDSTYTFIGTPTTNMIFTDDDKPLRYGWDYEITKVDSDGNASLVETFNSNVTICMPIPEEYLQEQDLTVDDIFAKYWDENSGSWKVPTSAVITEDGFACLQVGHFTEFALTTGATFGAAAAGGPAYVVATPQSGGGPQVTVWDGDGEAVLNFFAYASTLRIGIQAVAGDLDGDGTDEIVVAPGAGAGPQLRIFDLNGNVIDQFWAFASHIRTGVKIAVADVDDDGNDEIIVTTMAGAGPQLRIFNGSGEVESQFFVFAQDFRGGINMTTGDVDDDGIPEIIVIPESSAGPRVKVYNYDGSIVSEFWAYASTIQGGYHITTGDVNDDGTADIVVAPKAGLGPQVAMFTGTGDLIGRFFAYATTFRGGVNVSVGDISGNGTNEIVVSPESNAGPHLRIFDTSGNVVSQFWAYASTLRGNFTSLVADLDQDGTVDVVTAPGAGMGPHVRAFDYSGNPVAQFFTHHTGFRGGIDISSVPVF